METEKDYFLEEVRKAHLEYLKAEEEYHNYFAQFCECIENGKVVKKRTKFLSPEEWEKLDLMRKEVEEKRQKFKKAEQELRSFSS